MNFLPLESLFLRLIHVGLTHFYYFLYVRSGDYFCIFLYFCTNLFYQNPLFCLLVRFSTHKIRIQKKPLPWRAYIPGRPEASTPRFRINEYTPPTRAHRPRVRAHTDYCRKVYTLAQHPETTCLQIITTTGFLVATPQPALISSSLSVSTTRTESLVAFQQLPTGFP